MAKSTESDLLRQASSLTRLLHDLTLDAPNGRSAREIAELLDKPYVTLLAELGGQERHKLAMGLLVPLMELTGSDAPLHYLAQRRGGVFIKLPPVNRTLPESHRAAIRAAAEFGDAMRAYEHALDPDGPGGARLTQDELRGFLREGAEAMTAIQAFVEAVKTEFRAATGQDPDALLNQ